MTSRLFKIVVILVVSSSVAGCKLAVMVPSGGDVTSQSGTRNCAGGSLCEFEVKDTNFTESFTAVARPGYVFSKWNKGSSFFCGDSVNPVCTINTTTLPQGNAGIDDLLAGGKLLYAMPLFEFVGIDTDGDGIKDHLDADDDNDGVLDVDDNCPIAGPNTDGFGCPSLPITDTITADGKVWAQVDLLKGLTWNQIDAVCPAGVCVNGGVLNGYDMTGWSWASIYEVNHLFVSYGIPSQSCFVVSCAGVNQYASAWGSILFDAGWRPTRTETAMGDTLLYIMGWTRTEYVPEDRAYTFQLFNWVLDLNQANGSDVAGWGEAFKTGYINNDPAHHGAWFYRPI